MEWWSIQKTVMALAAAWIISMAAGYALYLILTEVLK